MSGVSLTQALRRNAELFPDRVATSMGNRTTDWRTTLDRVARLAEGFKRIGASRGDRIAILALNSDHYIVAIYAILWAGCIPVPLNNRWALAELQHALGDCAAKLVLFDDTMAATIDRKSVV